MVRSQNLRAELSPVSVYYLKMSQHVLTLWWRDVRAKSPGCGICLHCHSRHLAGRNKASGLCLQMAPRHEMPAWIRETAVPFTACTAHHATAYQVYTEYSLSHGHRQRGCGWHCEQWKERPWLCLNQRTTKTCVCSSLVELEHSQCRVWQAGVVKTQTKQFNIS